MFECFLFNENENRAVMRTRKTMLRCVDVAFMPSQHCLMGNHPKDWAFVLVLIVEEIVSTTQLSPRKNWRRNAALTTVLLWHTALSNGSPVSSPDA